MRPALLAAGAALVGCLVAACEDGAANSTGASAPRRTGEVAMGTWSTFYQQQKDRIPQELVTNPGTPWGDYVGSGACAGCHEEEHRRWRKSFHSRTLYSAAEGTVFGQFDDQIIDVAAFDSETGREMPAPYVGQVFTRESDDGAVRFFMHVRNRSEAEGWPRGRSRNTYGRGRDTIPEVGQGIEQEVILAFGNRRHQPYVARWRAPGERGVDGKHFVLPFYWNDVEKRWLYDGFRPYVESCAACHTTGIKRSETPWHPRQLAFAHTDPGRGRLYNLEPSEEGWAEGAVGCEVCHGPGREHVAAVERAGVARYREMRKTGEKPPSIFPSARGAESQERLTQQCDSCHDFHTESSLTLVPGPDGYGRDAPHWPLSRRADKHFAMHYPDGSPKSPCSIGTLYRSSRMFHEGIHCFDCHDPHGSEHFGSLREPVHDNALCISCHDAFADVAAQTAHSLHQAASPGNRCVECHMPRHGIFTNGVHMMSDRIHSHAFSIPLGGARQGAPPTSCNICHVDQDEGWSRAEIRRMWPGTATRTAAPPWRPRPGRQRR